MIEDRVKFISENLARGINRRKFLRRAGETAFAGMAALASGHLLVGNADARRGPDPRPQLLPRIPQVPNCSPPGPYCNYEGNPYPYPPDSCHGAHCFQHLYQGQILQCQVYYAYYPGGCWTASNGQGGYWTCCDCECGGGVTHCGCAQCTGTGCPAPAPVPATPGR